MILTSGTIVRFSTTDDQLPYASNLLSQDERARWARALPQVQRRAWARRAFTRRVLGGVLGEDPARIEFDVEPGGKPRLIDDRMWFSCSSSGDHLIVAVADRPVGVDVEQVRADLDPHDLARRYFSPEERMHLEHEAYGDALVERFLLLWTAKEALGKATGEGVTPWLDTTVLGDTVTCGDRTWRLDSVGSLPAGLVATTATRT